MLDAKITIQTPKPLGIDMTEKNSNLHSAKKAKNDEFYTKWYDIESEMQAYIQYNPNVFKDKVILLPCDDPEWSNFTMYFAQNFERFGIKKLISTSYAHNSKHLQTGYQPSLLEQQDPRFNAEQSASKGKIFTLTKDTNLDGIIDFKDIEWAYLEGDGDFRSPEITALRDEADFIITNPPFSLFREFLAWIVEAGKQFSIIGNMNAITYKEIFPLIKNNKMWLGVHNGAKEYLQPDGEMQKMGNTLWFTNIEHGRRHEPLALMTMEDNLKNNATSIEKNPNFYQKYDNYDAIEIAKTGMIPSDYTGVMGVPISFLDKYCPEQFDIIGATESEGRGFSMNLWDSNSKVAQPLIEKKRIYKRIFIRHKNQTPTKKETNHAN